MLMCWPPARTILKREVHFDGVSESPGNHFNGIWKVREQSKPLFSLAEVTGLYRSSGDWRNGAHFIKKVFGLQEVGNGTSSSFSSPRFSITALFSSIMSYIFLFIVSIHGTPCSVPLINHKCWSHCFQEWFSFGLIEESGIKEEDGKKQEIERDR